MTLTHWLKLFWVVVWLWLIVWVLSTCSVKEPARKPAIILSEAPRRSEPNIAAWKADQTQRRAQRDRDRNNRRQGLEAAEEELRSLLTEEIPEAIQDLASEAERYRVKRPDLKHLSKPEQREREKSVKAALERARAITERFYAVDRQAQMERAGPTVFADSDREAFHKRIELFRRGSEDLASFASYVAGQYGKLLEKPLLVAVEAIAKSVLPADALDLCRDPAVCRKPDIVAGPAIANKFQVLAGAMPSCVPRAPDGRDLHLYAFPRKGAAVLMRLAPGQCGILPVPDDARRSNADPQWQRMQVGSLVGWLNARPERPLPGVPTMPQADASITTGLRTCASARALGGQPLPLRVAPDPHSPSFKRLRGGDCSLRATGVRSVYPDPSGPAEWLEVIADSGEVGWVSGYFVHLAK